MLDITDANHLAVRFAEDVTGVGLQELALPEVRVTLVFRTQSQLVGEHEVAVIPQPRPLLLGVGKLALLDDRALGVQDLPADQFPGTWVGSEKSVTVVD